MDQEDKATATLTSRAVLRLAAILGVAGFGGGVAVISMVRRKLVSRAAMLSEAEFLKYLGLAQSLPGGLAINLFTQLGYRTGGAWVALLSTAIFVFPSAILMAVLAMIYPALREVPRVDAVFAGLNAGVLAIVTAAALQLGWRMTRWVDFLTASLVALAVSLRLVTVLEALLAVTAGAITVAAWRERPRPMAMPLILALPLPKTIVLLPTLAPIFLQIGVSLFGGGLAMIPMIDHQIVARGWLSAREFQDTITLSQLTPGPVATACTFVGYRLAGLGGAITATLAVFTPPFLFSILAARSAIRFERNHLLRAVLASLGPASVGLIAAAAVSLGVGELHGIEPWVLASACLFFLLLFNTPPLLVLVPAGALGALATFWTR